MSIYSTTSKLVFYSIYRSLFLSPPPPRILDVIIPFASLFSNQPQTTIAVENAYGVSKNYISDIITLYKRRVTALLVDLSSILVNGSEEEIDNAQSQLDSLSCVFHSFPSLLLHFVQDLEFVDVCNQSYQSLPLSMLKTSVLRVFYALCTNLTPSSSPSLTTFLQWLLVRNRDEQMPLFIDLIEKTKFIDKVTIDQELVSDLLQETACCTVQHKQKGKQDHNAKVTAIKDLFPNLESAFITACLESNNWNQEKTVAQLVEDSFSPESVKFDKPSVPSGPRVMDSEFRRESADLFADKEYLARNKENILASLYLSDDERDDTYDLVDDTLVPEPTSKALDENDSALYQVWVNQPVIFDRKSRKSDSRSKLKEETGLSDEQIEGWARMIQLDQKKLRLLASNYEFHGNQIDYCPRKWSPNSEKGEESPARLRRGSGHGRRRGSRKSGRAPKVPRSG